MDVEASVDRLLSYEAIRQLAYRYAIAVDARDVETVTGMFVEDVKVGPDAVGRPGELVGRLRESRPRARGHHAQAARATRPLRAGASSAQRNWVGGALS